MASKALVTISGAPFPSSPNKPRISTASFNAHFSSFKPNPTAASRISSSTGFVSTAVPITRKRSVFVRAEANSDGDDANPDNAAAVAPEEDPEAQAEAEAEDKDGEEKPTPAGQRKPRVKLGEIMGILNKRAVEAAEKERPTPDIRTGDVVEIKLEVPENRRRVSIYKGIVMSKQNAGIHTTIRIRRIIAGIGVEIVFPVYSPNIKEIKVVSHRKVRRARLYYLRDKLPKFSTFK